jgi:hypothetical protein
LFLNIILKYEAEALKDKSIIIKNINIQFAKKFKMYLFNKGYSINYVCRRSFATNFYGRIPTPILMNITAHGTEKMYLAYIGKTTYDNAFQMLDYFSKLVPRVKTPPTMEVLRNVK